MPIRTRATVNVKPIQDEIDVLNTFSDIIIEAGQQTEAIIKPQFLDEAEYYPPRKDQKFEFNTDKSRGWWFAAINGSIPGVVIPTDGRRYKRSGKLKESFFVKTVVANNSFEIVLGSNSDIIKWVMGTFDRRRNYQVRGHKATGWLPIAKTADFWIDTAEETFLDLIPTVFAEWDVTRQNR